MRRVRRKSKNEKRETQRSVKHRLHLFIFCCFVFAFPAHSAHLCASAVKRKSQFGRNTFLNTIQRLVVTALVSIVTAIPALAASCESLRELKLKDTTINSAATVAAGEFSLPGGPASPLFKKLPAFCRVTAEIKPTGDSDIKVEVWLPLTGWNGKYAGQGNGGFAGSINYQGLAAVVAIGYAGASTDTGHSQSEPGATWALKHQEKIVDFGYRAIHEMSVKARTVIQAFYGNPPRHSYFAGCSNGGRQALMEAQRYPDDYDGIIAGAPANYWTHLLTAGIWDLQALQKDAPSYISAAKIPALNDAVLAACDAQDGVKDGIVGNPAACRFDPSAMLCKEADSNGCLTAAQVEALKKIYSGPRNSKGAQIFPGFSPGGESGGQGWAVWMTPSSPEKSLQSFFSLNFFRDMVFNDPAWDFKTFNFDTDVKIADEKQSAALNAIDPNLKAFKSRGGRLILYHGWSDAAIPPLNAIDYFNSVQAAVGARDTEQFARLYMVPGMQHCGAGPGADTFGQFTLPGYPTDPQHSIFSALDQWVEKGTPPGQIIATKYVNYMDPAQGIKLTRPLCAYPQVSKYKGTGDTKDAANFKCE